MDSDQASCDIHCVDERKVRAVRDSLLESDVYNAVAETLGALADPNRAKIVHSLLRNELCVCDIAALLGISEAAVSQHLRLLRALRLVKYRREGRMAYYSLNDEHVRTLFSICLEHVLHD